MIVSGPSFDVKTKQTTLVDTFIANVLTAEQAEARDAERARVAHNEAIKEQMDANDVRRGRTLSDAFLHGIDTPLDEGKSPRDRLQAIETAQAELRAQLL